ncbi:MAG: Gfo/Idh/MocA family protein [Planctomycetota bacterium]|jgi:predicted dehydrogenase
MSTPIPIAIVGLNFGRHIVESIVNGPAGEHVSLAAVCDMDEEKARAFGDDHGVPHYTDLDELLANDEIPAIGLFTGPVGRAGLLTRVIEAGKDVMTTKPFELDCEAGLAVLRRARELGRVLHLNSPAPTWSPDLDLVKQWREKHDLGRPVGCQLSVWVRYNEEADGRWLDDPEKCPVAPIFRLGIYLINDLVQLFGEAERVSVFSSRLNTGRPTPDNAQLSILFGNGALATIYASFCVEDGDFYRNGMTLNFERGTVYRGVGPVRTTGQGGPQTQMSLVMGSGETPRAVVEDEVAPSTSGNYQWDAFAAAVRGEGADEVTTSETVIAGLRIIEAMARAEREGGIALVEPVEG